MRGLRIRSRGVANARRSAATCAPHVGAAATVRDGSECRQGPDGAAVVSIPAPGRAWRRCSLAGMPATGSPGMTSCTHGRMTRSKSGGSVIRSRLRPLAQPRDRDCDQDASERAEHGETGRDGTVSPAEIRMGVSDGPRRAGTAIGLLITQRSRVQIPPPLLVSAGQGPFLFGRGPLAYRAL
jgi:hypothetical protein